MVRTVEHPLEWYVNKLLRREPFSLLTYGDGEWLVMLGEQTGQHFTQYQELVTPSLRNELLASLDDSDPSVIRGTDLNIINWRDYKGNDASSFCPIGQKVEWLLKGRSMEFADGVVWDTAAKTGNLAPFLRALRGKEVVLVGNPMLKGFEGCQFADLYGFVPIPKFNTASMLNVLEAECVAVRQGRTPIYLVCVGLGAIPLVMRLRRQMPEATFLDLGSTFDMFVGLGSERGWRQELYQNQEAWDALIKKNLGGV